MICDGVCRGVSVVCVICDGVCRVLASAGKNLGGFTFLECLAEREEANRNGKIAVSLYN